MMQNQDAQEVTRALEALVDFVAELNLAFNATDPRESDLPFAARQLRYFRAMRAVGNLLESIGQRQFKGRFYELAEALHELAIGRPHPLFQIEDSLKQGSGRRHDRPEFWRIRANLCVGLRYLVAGGATEDDAINQTLEKYEKELKKLQRPGTKDFKKAIAGWLISLKDRNVSNSVALSVFEGGMSDLASLRLRLTGAELKKMGEELIKRSAEKAEELL
jgi:hypothetical protein